MLGSKVMGRFIANAQYRRWRAEAKAHKADVEAEAEAEAEAETETGFYRSYDLLQIMVEVEKGRRIFVDRF